MAEPALPDELMTLEEYLEFERNSPVKHEYVGGHVYAMTGVTRRHSRIALNLARKLADAAGAGPCRVHQSDMQVPTPDGPWYYPDIVVACGSEPDDPYIEDAPCLLIEVLSPTTASTDRREKLLADRREKLLAYRRIPSLRAYLLVEQDRTMVECHYRDGDGPWRSLLVDSGTVAVPCPETALSLTDIYAGV
jgi:Uma2 family endonuclease